MTKRSGLKICTLLLFVSFLLNSQATLADLTFQAYNNGGGETRLIVESASGTAVDSDNNAYFYGFGQVLPWDGQLSVAANSVSGMIAGSTLQPNQVLMNASAFDGTQTGLQIVLASDAGSLVGSDASIVFPLDPSNFSVQYTLNVAFGTGNLGVITILPVDPNLPPLTGNAAPVPLQGAAVLIILLGLTGIAYSHRKC